MFRRLGRMLRPELFQGVGQRGSYFEGWYFKVVFPEKSYALIPGISRAAGDDHAFVQVLDGHGGSAAYHRFDHDAFEFSDDPFGVSIAGHQFGFEGVRIAVDDFEAELKFEQLHRWPRSTFAPGAMGWYTFVPFMQCYHGILALDGSVSGTVGGEEMGEGRLYIEKDWGTSFPRAWIWLQTNNFEETGCSLTCSIATVPWIRGEFTGFIIGLLANGELYRFTTYTGAAVERIRIADDTVEILIRRGTLRLEIRAHKTVGADLVSPLQGAMQGRVSETLTSSAEVVLRDGDRVLFEGMGRDAGLEVVNPEELDGAEIAQAT